MSATPDPREYPDPIKECWAVHQTLRTLGFPADDIFVAKGQDAKHPFQPPAIFVVLRSQGQEFTITLGVYKTEKDTDEALSQWTEFATLFNNRVFAEDHLNEIFEASHITKSRAAFVVALNSRGFHFPALTN